MDKALAHDRASVEPSDEALCERVAGKDRIAFDLLVERHQAKAYRLAWSILRDADDARDVSQEAFIRLFQAAGSFDGRARFSTWFHRILVNLCLDHQRKNRWWRRLSFSTQEDDPAEDPLARTPAPDAGPEEQTVKTQTLAMVFKAMERLSPKQRAVLTMQTQQDLSTEEIAAVMGCSEATVRVHLHRALTQLKKQLGG